MLAGTEKEEEEDDDDEKEGFARVCIRSLGEVLLRYCWGSTAARPLGACPAHKTRMGFYAFKGGGLVEVLLGRHCCHAPRSVPCA